MMCTLQSFDTFDHLEPKEPHRYRYVSEFIPKEIEYDICYEMHGAFAFWYVAPDGDARRLEIEIDNLDQANALSWSVFDKQGNVLHKEVL